MATFRGPIRPSRRTLARPADDQLPLPLPRPSARQAVWEPGDPLYDRPAEVDPDPRPAVLADQPDDPDAATWRPDDRPLVGGGPGRQPARLGRGRRAAGAPRRSLLGDEPLD